MRSDIRLKKMQPSRRRKKRPNYGMRTVEVCRGKNGFGFTISGQQPCILSCIVPNSPAEQAGLRPGDYLIAVCGQNVSKVPHDDVVQLIGNCHGILKLQIAENYYSDSSEEDFVTTVRQKPKYPAKYKTNGHNTHPMLASKSHKFGNHSADGLFRDKPDNRYGDDGEVSNKKPDSFPPYSDVENPDMLVEANTIYQCLVGYLGTIEMPKILTPVSRQQIIRSCIKRLRAEKRNYTPVMMTIFPCSLRLKNDLGTTIAVYPGGRVTFCSSSSEMNRKYFGIVTTSVSDEPSNSCHVFVTLSSAHDEHSKIAFKFALNCDPDCNHFPATSDPVVNAIRKYYETPNRNDIEEPLVANSPQPSNDSSVTTSNSDSGIGFRDESGHQSDRILVVDIQNQRLHIQAVGQPDPQYIDCYADKSDSRNSTRANSTTSAMIGNESLREAYNVGSRESIFSWNAKSMYASGSPARFLHKSCDNGLSEVGISTAVEASLERRLSPKVFSNMSDVVPVSQSMEDLKTQSELYEDLEPVDSFMKKRSLQDLTVFSSECEVQEKPQQCETSENERKVTSWATSLEKLLYDSVGLHAFAEFLKKEFSIENAYFWAACEKYRRTTNLEERKKLASNIYEKFLSNLASEPVNVDSSGKNFTQQQLQSADVNLLSNAQKQIFNLMKFDSYPRFLKSDIYKNYLMREISGENVTLSQSATDCDLLLSPNAQTANAKEAPEEAERTQRTSRRRRSLLLWTKSRCKSRDRTASHENMQSSCSSSRTSLASWDLALPVSLCRVLLPDASSAVLNIQPHQTVYYLISKLLEKRAMPYTSFQVIFTATDKVVDLEESASVLAGKEVKIEWRIEFRLDLPDRKSLTVKSKPSHTLGAVLGPILVKHGYNLQMVTLCLIEENEVLEPSSLVSTVDKQRIQVLTRSTPTPNLQGWSNYYNVNTTMAPKQSSTLDEITNRVFEELLQGKAENFRNPNTEPTPSIYSENYSSEHSSKILGKFLRKDSFHQDKHRKNKKCNDVTNNSEKKSTNSRLPPVIAKWKPGSKHDSKFEKDGLYEGLKRCQRGRLEDQRGTELNIELPDFLKDKENTPSGRKKLKKIRKDASCPSEMKSLQSCHDKDTKEEATAAINENEYNSCKLSDTYQTPSDCKRQIDDEQTSCVNDLPNFSGKLDNSPAVFKEPPPLPPKPKNISWRMSSGTYGFDTSPKSVYLDQPTSSFV